MAASCYLLPVQITCVHLDLCVPVSYDCVCQFPMIVIGLLSIHSSLQSAAQCALVLVLIAPWRSVYTLVNAWAWAAWLLQYWCTLQCMFSFHVICQHAHQCGSIYQASLGWKRLIEQG